MKYNQTLVSKFLWLKRDLGNLIMKSETQDQTQALDVPSSLPVFCDGLSFTWGEQGTYLTGQKVRAYKPLGSRWVLTQHYEY